MKRTIRYLFFLGTLICFTANYSQTDTTQSGGSFETLRSGFVQKMGQFFDVRMLDHTIQTRGAVRRQGVKDSLEHFSDRTRKKLAIALISQLNIAEVWPNILNRRKYYSVDGKYALDSVYFMDTAQTEDAYIIGIKIDVDTLVSRQAYGITMSGSLDGPLTAYLAEKGNTTLEARLNSYFTSYFAAHPGPWPSPNDAPIAPAITGALALLDSVLSPYYAEMAASQLTDESFPAAAKGFQVTYSASTTQQFGFDSFQYDYWIQHYDFVELGDRTLYAVPAKSSKIGVADETIAATFVIDSTHSGSANNIKFKTEDNDSLAFTRNGNDFEITLPNYSKKGSYIIYAYHNDDKLGKLTVAVYEGKTEKVVIVPVNCSLTSNASVINTYLNQVYKNGVVDWEVVVDPTWNDSTWDQDSPGKLQSEDANLMHKYSPEMRALRNAYFSYRGDSAIDQAHYLFIVNDFTQFNMLGYMVIGRSVGFIKKMPANDMHRTIAHELGHGAFGLRHHFGANKIPRYSSIRLMDYRAHDITHLCKPEWDEIHSKLPDWSRFDDDEEFASVKLDEIKKLRPLANTDGSFTFYQPNLQKIVLPANITGAYFSTLDNLLEFKYSMNTDANGVSYLESLKKNFLQLFESGDNLNAPLGTLLGFNDANGDLYVFESGYYNKLDGSPFSGAGNSSNLSNDGIRMFLAPTSGIPLSGLFSLVGGTYPSSFSNHEGVKIDMQELADFIAYGTLGNTTPYRDVLSQSSKPLVEIAINNDLIQFNSPDIVSNNERYFDLYGKFLTLQTITMAQFHYYFMLANLEATDYGLVYNCDALLRYENMSVNDIIEDLMPNIPQDWDADKEPMVTPQGLSTLVLLHEGNKVKHLANQRDAFDSLYLNSASANEIIEHFRKNKFEYCYFSGASFEAKLYVLEQLFLSPTEMFTNGLTSALSYTDFGLGKRLGIINELLYAISQGDVNGRRFYHQFVANDSYAPVAEMLNVWSTVSTTFGTDIGDSDKMEYKSILLEILNNMAKASQGFANSQSEFNTAFNKIIHDNSYFAEAEAALSAGYFSTSAALSIFFDAIDKSIIDTRGLGLKFFATCLYEDHLYKAFPNGNYFDPKSFYQNVIAVNNYTGFDAMSGWIHNFPILFESLSDQVDAIFTTSSGFNAEINNLLNAQDEKKMLFAAALLHKTRQYEVLDHVVEFLRVYADENWYALVGVEEIVVLEMIKALENKSVNDINSFIGQLQSRLVKNRDWSLVRFYYSKLNTSSFEEYVQILGDYARRTYSVQTNFAPLLISFEVNDGLIFYDDNIQIAQDNNQLSLGFGFEWGECPPPEALVEYALATAVFLDLACYIDYGNVDYFTPFLNINIDNAQGAIAIPQGAIPVTALEIMAVKDANTVYNSIAAAELVFDIVTTFSGFGNLLKLRLLAKGAKVATTLTTLEKVKIVIGGVEFASGVASFALRYGTDNCQSTQVNPEFCAKMQNLLFWLEIGSMSSDLLIRSKIKASANDFSNRYDELAAASKAENASSSTIQQYESFKNKVPAAFYDELRVMADISRKTSMLSRFRHHTKVRALINSLDEVRDKSKLEKLDEAITTLNPAQLTRLNRGLTPVSLIGINNELGELIIKLADGNTSVLARITGADWTNSIGKLAEDLAGNSAFKNEVLGNVDLIDAWETIIGNPMIRKDIKALESVSKIIDNTNLASVITKTDLSNIVNKLAQKGVKCRTCTGGNSTYKYLDEILDDIEFGAVKYGSEYTSVLTGFKQGGNFAEGAMYVASSLKKYPNEFPSNTIFEYTTKTTADNIRRVDVKVPGAYNGKDVFYEFKSVATNGMPPYGFANQFVKDLDLPDVTNLNQLKWWFDGGKVSSLSKADFISSIQSATINQNIINKLVKTGPKTKQALVNLIDSNFDIIFIVK